MRLARVQKVHHGLAAVQVLRAFGQCHPVARARQIDAQNFADGGGRPVGHHHDAVGEQHCFVHVVRHHDHRALRVGDDLHQLVLQLGAGQCVECAKRFVQQQHLGFHAQRTGNADALFHTAGNFTRSLLRGGGQAHHGERRFGARLELRPILRRAEDALDRQVHVFMAGEPGQQRMVLKHHRALRAGAGDFPVGAQQGALRWRGQAGHQVEQGGLAATGMADQGDELAFGDSEVDIFQCAEGALFGFEGLFHALDFDVFGGE